MKIILDRKGLSNIEQLVRIAMFLSAYYPSKYQKNSFRLTTRPQATEFLISKIVQLAGANVLGEAR